jgi:predicted DNA-binding protein with PD1-like motif
MILRSSTLRRLIAVRLDPGEDLLLALRRAARESGIGHGLVLTGIGSLSRYRVHVVQTTDLPPGDVFFEDEGPYDILQLTGYVLDGRVHAHLTVSNTQKAVGGHLEGGCRVLTFAVLTLAEAGEDLDLTDWDRVGPLPSPP